MHALSPRRNDHDVTDCVRTTDPRAVRREVLRLYDRLYQGRSASRTARRAIARGFAHVAAAFRGQVPGLHACETPYHDLQHTLETTLAAARMLDGYERGRRAEGPLAAPDFALGVLVALFHDVGYLRRSGDRRHAHGAEYTLTHVSRGAVVLRRFLESVGMAAAAPIAARLIHFTGYERQPERIALASALHRRIGQIVGSADILGQMSDRCYLEKCRERLYPELVIGGIARRRLADGSVLTLFESGDDLVQKTPLFWQNAKRRLEGPLGSVYRHAERHFRGENPYLDATERNVRYAARVRARNAAAHLRRRPPVLDPALHLP